MPKFTAFQISEDDYTKLESVARGHTQFLGDRSPRTKGTGDSALPKCLHRTICSRDKRPEYRQMEVANDAELVSKYQTVMAGHYKEHCKEYQQAQKKLARQSLTLTIDDVV